ncbi:MAG: hypothetical protein ACU0AX_06770 [Roseovarius sp.]|uniref:hypothetical protein n=1 Tax=Roseovarius sp. TaxID=1486281 RepID=UPI004059DDA9
MIKPPVFDKVLLALVVANIFALIVFHFVQTDVFQTVYAAEDGPAEWATIVLLFLSFTVLARQALRFAGAGERRAVVTMAVGAALFFFAAGEEISWGQRIFDWQAPEIITDNSFRSETNLHNLKVGEVKLVKVLFGNVLTVVLLGWLVGLTVLYSRSARVAALADRWAVPVAGYRHAVLVLAASVVIAVVDLQRKWEIYETIFSFVALSIFLYPQNGHVFARKSNPVREDATVEPRDA